MFSKTPKKTHLILALVFSLSIAYVVVTIFGEDVVPQISEHSLGTNIDKQGDSRQALQTVLDETSNHSGLSASVPRPYKHQSLDTVGLPVRLHLVYVSNQDEGFDGDDFVIIARENDERDFVLGDSVYFETIILSKIMQESAVVTFNDTQFTLELDRSYREKGAVGFDAVKDFEEYLAMTPDQINTRPKILEHIFNLTPTRLLPEGMLVSAGINKKLFEQAGFEEDDIILSVNNMDIELDYLDIQSMLPSARMLTFELIRKGKRITIYLDIPDEELSISP